MSVSVTVVPQEPTYDDIEVESGRKEISNNDGENPSAHRWVSVHRKECAAHCYDQCFHFGFTRVKWLLFVFFLSIIFLIVILVYEK